MCASRIATIAECNFFKFMEVDGDGKIKLDFGRLNQVCQFNLNSLTFLDLPAHI